MKVLTNKFLASLLSLAFLVSFVGGCAQEAAESTPEGSPGAASDDPGTNPSSSGVDVPSPEATEGGEEAEGADAEGAEGAEEGADAESTDGDS